MKTINPLVSPDPELKSLADHFVEALAEMAAERYVQARIEELELARKGFCPPADRAVAAFRAKRVRKR